MELRGYPMTINKTPGYLLLTFVFFTNSGLAQNAVELSSEETVQPEQTAGESKKPISLGLLLGYGIDLEEESINPFGFGFGLRGGYTLDMGLYLGAQFIYFIGDSFEDPTSGTKGSINVIPISIEGGYDIDLEAIVIRPSLGSGIALISTSAEGNMMGLSADGSGTVTKFFIAPGASVIYPFNGFFIGADLRFMLIFDKETLDALTTMANAGINL